MLAADLQGQIASAMLTFDLPERTPKLIGGGDPTRRLAIHTRHYRASVGRAIVERFAATVWLVGSDPVIRAAAAFVREHPPTMPCIAEYGDAFPAYLSSFGDGALPPYVAEFATLDWHLGRVAIAADVPPLTSLAHCDAARVTCLRVTLQDGVIYVPLTWSVDELIAFYLSGDAPESYALRDETVWLELRGSRGELWMQRLARGEFVFRAALAQGVTLGDAAALGTDADTSFSPPEALGRLLAAGLVTGVRDRESEADDVRGL